MVADLRELSAVNGQGFLFSTDRGAAPVCRKYVCGGLLAALRKIGMTKTEIKERGLCFHAWRHFCNTEMQRAGLSVQKVQAVTGHKSDRMTEWYCHFNPAEFGEVPMVQEALLQKGGEPPQTGKDYDPPVGNIINLREKGRGNKPDNKKRGDMSEKAYKRIRELSQEISSGLTREAARKEGEGSSWSRQRKMPLSDMLICILAKKGLSTVMEIRDYFGALGKEEETVSTQGYLRQRQKLNPDVFKLLNGNYLRRFYGGEEAEGWRGYLVMATDGSRAEIPNSAENRRTYGENGNQHGETSVRANVSTLYDVYNRFIVDIGIHSCQKGEIEEAKEQIESLKGAVAGRKTLIIFDRGYASLEFIDFLEKSGMFYLIRLQSGSFKAERAGMSGSDGWLEIKHTAGRLRQVKETEPGRWREMAEEGGTWARMVKAGFQDEKHGMLVTNLKEGSAADIRLLYRKRWMIEQKYHTLKNKMKFESVTGKASIYVKQDFWAQMLVFNIIQDLITAAEKRAVEKSRKKQHKYEIRINENIAIGLFKKQFINLMMEEDDFQKSALFSRLTADMEKYIVPVRNNQKSSPRKWKRCNKYKCNLKPSF
jgi:hypothetical protein